MFKKSLTLLNAIKYVNKILQPLEEVFYYHNYNHSFEVFERCIYLGEKEFINDNDLEILGFASIFHDTGFLVKYDGNEEFGAEIARKYLVGISYSEKKIQKIEKLILATKVDYKEPKNLLEKIIKDADLDNLGRDDFFKIKDNLKKELEGVKKMKIKDIDWNKKSLTLLKNHIFYTKTQFQERELGRLENIKKLEFFIR